ncbi:mycophenolic acid acyl-glucuronide esterase, mitochondrial-like isoform X2 [Anneissia japonica]|uniref:mycophenolic acid acyl-glucuronide esterase, mitochondrial-like isoform X2 n=1 Tax=Anneissia japonica TaxID=1529436 RepID=UPI0014255EAF|nr:mycophenolic acid acyl-glucuronide esterase, mitochondrial-like isoform X2 [Anneissia japonica]
MSALCSGSIKSLSRRKNIVWPFCKYIYNMNHQASGGVEFLRRGNNNCLAYRWTKRSAPRPRVSDCEADQRQDDHHGEVRPSDVGHFNANGIMFLPGFLSNMNGGKALALEQFCKQSNYEFTRFDYQGCGESKGEINMNGTVFDVWKDDALAVLDNLTTGPQVLVGSSMGGAIMLLLALERPERVHSLVGIATPNYDKPFEIQIQADGNTKTKTSFDYIGQQNRDILASKSLAIQRPLRFIHGMQDDVVGYESALELANKVESEDVQVILQKSGSHRMSTPEGLQLMLKTVQDLLRINSRL